MTCAGIQRCGGINALTKFFGEVWKITTWLQHECVRPI